MTATRQEIGVRVDTLARAHQGDDYGSAIERLAEELGPDERPLLQEVLLERAAGEESFQRALRRRFEAKGRTRRSLARLEGLWRDDRADAVAAATAAIPEERDAARAATIALRSGRGGRSEPA